MAVPLVETIASSPAAADFSLSKHGPPSTGEEPDLDIIANL